MSKSILLFDVDGTLTKPRGVCLSAYVSYFLTEMQKVTNDMLSLLGELKAKGRTIAIVGGSDLVKQREQLGENGEALSCDLD
jgi:hydroxymethylpyrimidine pyrophosphatase-like HAD family hydrolase